MAYQSRVNMENKYNLILIKLILFSVLKNFSFQMNEGRNHKRQFY